MPLRQPLFLAFEGIDGSGKSTHIQLLAERLRAEGHRVHLTCEPTNSPMGKLIRDTFNHRETFDDRVIAGLFVADRLHHLLEKTHGILDLLEQGYTVLTDRFYLSSYAYQGAHMPMEWVIQANALSARLRRPDLHLFLDIAPEKSMERLAESRLQLEKYETLSNLQAVRAQYLRAIEQVSHEETILLLNADQSKQALAELIYNTLVERFPA